jgi:hydrogenase nickel incorporation protein HypB
MIVNKTDLLPHVQFDVCIEYARRINPALDVICVSATTGDGIDAWLDWVLRTGDAHDPLPRESASWRPSWRRCAQQRRAGDAA